MVGSHRTTDADHIDRKISLVNTTGPNIPNLMLATSIHARSACMVGAGSLSAFNPSVIGNPTLAAKRLLKRSRIKCMNLESERVR